MHYTFTVSSVTLAGLHDKVRVQAGNRKPTHVNIQTSHAITVFISVCVTVNF